MPESKPPASFVAVYRSVKTEHSVWQNSQWGSVDCQLVEEATTRQRDTVEAFPTFTQSWDIHQHLLSYLHATQVRAIYTCIEFAVNIINLTN